MFENLKTNDNVIEAKDTLGGNGPLPSALYNLTIDHAFLQIAKSKATGLVLHLKSEDGRTVRQTLWMTSGEAKGCKNTYEKDGKTYYLPGFEMANHLGLLTVGKEIADLASAAEQKVINLYNPTEQKEVPTEVPMLVELCGQVITAGVICQTVDKTVKGDDNKYHPTGETRDENEIDKFFRERDGLTVQEIKAGVETAAFMDEWSKKWTGVIRNRAKGTANGAQAGAPQAATAGSPKTSLFA